MGKLKDEATTNITEDIQQHKLTAGEMNYLRLLNIALQYHTMGQKIMSGFLYYICTNRLGYKDGTNLQFEINFDEQPYLDENKKQLNPAYNVLTVKMLPMNPAEATAMAEAIAAE